MFIVYICFLILLVCINELDDLVGFRTFGAQISVENLKDNLTAKLIF